VTTIFISPSLQHNNRGIGDYGTEAQRMRYIGERVRELLLQRGLTEPIISDPTGSLMEAIQLSNAVNADVHVAIHSNAGGGRGTEVFYPSGKVQGKKLATALYERVSPLFPDSNRATPIKPNFTYKELKEVYAEATALIEVGFHDSPQDARIIIDKAELIAQRICDGICDYLGVPTHAPQITIVYNGNTFQPKDPVELEDGVIYLSLSDAGEMVLNARALPLRKVMEYLGKDVVWDGNTSTVYINDREER